MLLDIKKTNITINHILLSRGSTLVDVYGVTNKKANVHVAISADNKKFMKLLFGALNSYN